MAVLCCGVQNRQCCDTEGEQNKQTGLKKRGWLLQPEGSSKGARTKLNSVLQKAIHPFYGELMWLTEHLQPLAFTPKVQHEVL